MLEKNQNPTEGQININTDFPVHTMKSDMEDIGQIKISNPNTVPGAMAETTVPKSGQDSPFLMQEEWQKSAAELKEENFADEKKSGLGRSIMWGIIIFAALAITAGAYYFWVTRNSDLADLPLESLPPASDVVEIPPIQFSTNTPNYLIINDADLPSGKFLDEYSQKVLSSSLATPVEFILTDSLNNPISFQDFAGKLGISLPESIMNKLKSSFSLTYLTTRGK